MRFYIETLGCKVNQYETQALETLLVSHGHEPCLPGEGCDAVIVNTCAVTAESGRKSRQAVRRLKKQEPGALAAVCGCYSQVSPEDVSSLGADIVYGSGDRHKFVSELEEAVSDKIVRQNIDDPMRRRMFEELPAGSVAGRTRAMLKIQDGCSNFCSYCIIPYARGPVRSLPLQKAVAEARRLNGEGYSEIIVTGIEISSYGKDFADGTTLLHAIRGVSAAAPDARLRLGSLEPTTVTEEFCAEIKKLPNLCDHFHLSLQSGCDETLRRMRRKYSTADFLQSVETLHRYYPQCGITADLIVGFPGETDKEFQTTLEFINQCAFSSMHIFPYSPRPGTPAAVMDNQVDKHVKQERAKAAAKAAEQMSAAFAESCVGKVLEVLFERETDGVSEGHAGNYMEVQAIGTGLRNHVLPVQITQVKSGSLLGEILRP
jgi:threonylcarbamoyladenosine tRNA methylthiotransferase MtaB